LADGGQGEAQSGERESAESRRAHARPRQNFLSMISSQEDQI